MNTRLDLLTGEKFQPKRINQKFSSSRNRIAYNNKKANEIRQEKAVIDKPLLKNYYILSELLGKQKQAVFHKEFLLGKGFSFEVSTHVEKYEGERRFGIYKFILVPVDANNYKIIQK